MRIDCYLSLGCTSEEALRENLLEALRALGLRADVRFHRLSTQEAARRGLRGSPSIYINGVDALPGQQPGFA
jgi:hypothetical protein